MSIKQSTPRGRALFVPNSVINRLPAGLQWLGYKDCGMKLGNRLARVDPVKNPLHAACKQLEIAYAQHSQDLETHHRTDNQL